MYIHQCGYGVEVSLKLIFELVNYYFTSIAGSGKVSGRERNADGKEARL